MRPIPSSLLVACFGLSACSMTRPQVAPGGEFRAVSQADWPQDSEADWRRPVRVRQEGWPLPIVDDASVGFLLFDQLEYRDHDNAADTLRWDTQGWYGGDYEKLWFRSEGDSSASGRSSSEIENQLLYSRVVAPFWDLQVGLRYDSESGSGPDRTRWFGVLGLQGFAPYRFDVEPALFISEDGDVSARLTGTTDWLITQRLVLQPRLEFEFALQDVGDFGVGSGLEYLDLGLRLRYEVRRELAPYLGLEWQNLLGETADLARGDGEQDSDLALVFGLRIWF